MSAKQRYVIQTNRTGGATFRVPLDSECSVGDAMNVISSRMSDILKAEVRVTNMLVSSTNLFKEDAIKDVVDVDEMINVQLVDAAALQNDTESKYIDMSAENKTCDAKEDAKHDPLRRSDECKQDGRTDRIHVAESKRAEVGSFGTDWFEADRLFHQSFAAALHDLLPSPALESLQEKIALAWGLRRAQSVRGDSADEKGEGKWEEDSLRVQCGSTSTPSMCLESFLSTWATEMLALMKEARACFDFHHLAHADDALLLPTTPDVYHEWLLEVPSIRTHGRISLVTWFRELETLRVAEQEAAAFLDAFAEALPVSPHDLNSLHALAERVHALQAEEEEAEASGGVATPTHLYKWAMECLALFKEVKACSDFHQLSHKRSQLAGKDGSSSRGGSALTPARAFEEWTVKVPDAGGVGLVEKNLLRWFWDLEKTREAESDAEQYLEAFAAAVDVPASSLRDDLSRARARVLHHPQARIHRGRMSQDDDTASRAAERELAWARYFVQLMKEARMCFVFDQLSHGNDRMMPNTSRKVFQEWTIDVEVINSESAGDCVGYSQSRGLSVSLVQWYHDLSAMKSAVNVGD